MTLVVDERTQQVLDDLDTPHEVCGHSEWLRRGWASFLTVDQYRNLLESGEVDASGRLRCAGWAQSQKRRCIARSSWQYAYRVSRSECCQHRGFWVSYGHEPVAIGEWFCGYHSEVSA
jgi:hypothetical protein